MTFVYDNIVSQQIVFAIFSIYLSKLILIKFLIYIDHVPGKQIPIAAV